MSIKPVFIDVAQAQLDAYNAHDINAFCACYADDVVVRNFPTGEITVSGMAAFRARYIERFKAPTLRAKLLSRMSLGDVVIDHEEVSGLAPMGVDGVTPLVVAIAMYRCTKDESGEAKIAEVWFIR
jgi:hypothetical protein